MVKLASMAYDRWIAPISFLLLLSAYHIIFGQFFPTINGTIGNDYSRVLPDLLDGYFWFRSNSIFEPFWFTPSFCGGQPALADPAFIYYSTAQALTVFVNPLTSIYLTVLLFASFGFWGAYLLLRSCFGVSHQAAVLGGALFMFNGFFIQRMMVGHFVYHGVMLIPLIAWLLLRPTDKNQLSSNLFNGIAAGCLLAYGAYSGLISLLLPCTLALMAIICMHGLVGFKTTELRQRWLVGAMVATALSAAKLAAALSFLHNFPRTDYSLPGATSLWNALNIIISALFLSPADIAEQTQHLFVKVQWTLDRHEWEYGVSLVPLLIILVGASVVLIRTRNIVPKINATKWAWLALLGIILALPLALNIYTPEWNAFLKQVPFIKSSSNLLRWFLIYIPVVILAAALLLDKISPLAIFKNGILIAALATLIQVNAFKDRKYYQTQSYRPETIVNAWQTASTSATKPQIKFIGAFLDTDNNAQMTSNGNDLIAVGASQLACYNAVFGYELEQFPVKSLHAGSVLDETDEWLNIKNPACYLYPKENNCNLGDHFALNQRKAAQAFANYKPYPFNFSFVQKIANWTTLSSLIILVLFFVTVLAKKILVRINANL
jgi:hypothetical protein